MKPKPTPLGVGCYHFEEITSAGEVSEPRLSVGLYPKIGRCGFLTAPDPTKNLLKNPRHPCNP